MSFIMIVEGNIGSGKSTLTTNLSEKMNWRPMYEPVKENPYLEMFYKDMSRWSLEMQYWMMANRYKLHQDGVKHAWSTHQPVIFDRSIYGDSIFATKLYRDGLINEIGYKSYMNMRDCFEKSLLVPQVTLYLDASPLTCFERIASRGRDCEKGLPLQYLIDLHEIHQEFLEDMNKRGSTVIKIEYNDFITVEDIIDHVKCNVPKNFERLLNGCL